MQKTNKTHFLENNQHLKSRALVAKSILDEGIYHTTIGVYVST